MRFNFSPLFFCEFLILLSFIFLCPSAFADTLYLKNGNKMEGIILGEETDKVVVQVKIGTITVKRGGVERIDKWSKEENQALEEKWLKQRKEDKERREKAKTTRVSKKQKSAKSKIRQKGKDTKRKIISPSSKDKSPSSKDEPYKDLLDKTILRKVSSNSEQSYYLYLPKQYSSSKKWPLFIGVHAYSFDGRQGMEFWRKFADPEGFILVCPSFKDGYQWLKYDTDRQMIDIIAELKEEFNIEEGKTFIAGFSAGAQFAHRFIFEYPEYVQGASIMAAGSFSRPYFSRDAEDIKFLVMVGEDDEKERVENTKGFAEQLKDEGYHVEFKSFPGIGHWVCEGEKQLTIDLFRRLKSE